MFTKHNKHKFKLRLINITFVYVYIHVWMTKCQIKHKTKLLNVFVFVKVNASVKSTGARVEMNNLEHNLPFCNFPNGEINTRFYYIDVWRNSLQIRANVRLYSTPSITWWKLIYLLCESQSSLEEKSELWGTAAARISLTADQ